MTLHVCAVRPLEAHRAECFVCDWRGEPREWPLEALADARTHANLMHGVTTEKQAEA